MRGDPFAIDVSTRSPAALPPEALFHYWHPGREGIEVAPESFMRQMRERSPDLRVHRPPPRAPTKGHPWLVWYRKPEIQHYLSPGWFLLRIWFDVLGDPLCQLLDDASARKWGSGADYFEHVATELAEGKARRDRARKAENLAGAKDYRQFTKIKNIGAGHKFALHHDGTLLPSRGERNWQHDLERKR